MKVASNSCLCHKFSFNYIRCFNASGRDATAEILQLVYKASNKSNLKTCKWGTQRVAPINFRILRLR